MSRCLELDCPGTMAQSSAHSCAVVSGLCSPSKLGFVLCNAEILEKILHETVSVVLYSCQFLWCPQGASFVTYVR